MAQTTPDRIDRGGALSAPLGLALESAERKAAESLRGFHRFLESVKNIKRGGVAAWVRLGMAMAWAPAMCFRKSMAALGFRGQQIRRAQSFWGKPFYLLLSEYSPGLMEFGFPFVPPERRLTKFLARTLKSGQVFFDAGAYIGYYSILASEAVGPTGQVHSFEPSPFAQRLLRLNCRVLHNVRIVCAALSDRSEEAREFFQCNQDSTAGSLVPVGDSFPYHIGLDRTFAKSSVRVWSVDEYCRSVDTAPDVLKIDVERTEALVLKGSQRVIRDHRPIICMEVWSPKEGRDDSADQEALTILDASGYGAHRIYDDGTPIPVRHVFDAIRESGGEHDNLVFLPR